MKSKLQITDFQVIEKSRGRWAVTFDDPETGKTYTGSTTDADLVDSFKAYGREPWLNDGTEEREAMQEAFQRLKDAALSGSARP